MVWQPCFWPIIRPRAGYPKIATVLDCDLDAAAQLRPHDAIGFTALTPAEAVSACPALRRQHRKLSGRADRRCNTAVILAAYLHAQGDRPSTAPLLDLGGRHDSDALTT